MKSKTVKQILIEYLKSKGYDGLYFEDCGCKLDCLIPCCEYFAQCKPGKIAFDEDGNLIIKE
jgi:hypothetical protein